jgi:hypothetical protein
MPERDARSMIGPMDAENRLMNYGRQWQASSVTNDVSFQPQELGNHRDLVPDFDDLGRHSERMSAWKDELGKHDINVGESDKVAYSASSSLQFYVALAIGGIIAGVGLGWSFGVTKHQLFASNPATTLQKQTITRMPALNEKTTATSNSQKSAPIAASREPEPNSSSAPTREPRLSTKTLPSKAKHDSASSEVLVATAQQRGKTLNRAAPVPETKPQTVEGWMIRDIVGNTVVLEGPEGVWRVTQGDTVPGVGKVGSIVRWGNRWIVSTTRGLISTQ